MLGVGRNICLHRFKYLDNFIFYIRILLHKIWKSEILGTETVQIRISQIVEILLLKVNVPRKEAEASVSREVTKQQLIKQFELNPETAEENLRLHW